MVIVCKVASTTNALVRLLVNNSEFNPFKNGCELFVWGTAEMHTYAGIQNVLAGDHANFPPEMDLLVGDVLTIKITCDVPEQSLGLGLRPIKVSTVHASTANITIPTVTSEAVFILDESYVEGQNINSVGVWIDGGTWDATSNYSLGRLNP